MTESEDIRHEERGIYAVVIAAMVPIVVGTLVVNDVFAAGSTISLALLVLAVCGLFVLHRTRRALPRARTKR